MTIRRSRKRRERKSTYETDLPTAATLLLAKTQAGNVPRQLLTSPSHPFQWTSESIISGFLHLHFQGIIQEARKENCQDSTAVNRQNGVNHEHDSFTQIEL